MKKLFKVIQIVLYVLLTISVSWFFYYSKSSDGEMGTGVVSLFNFLIVLYYTILLIINSKINKQTNIRYGLMKLILIIILMLAPPVSVFVLFNVL
jgi:hypothetical protein